MTSRRRRGSAGKKRTETQLAIVALRQTRNFTQQDLATHMRRNTATIGRWEAIRPPRGVSLSELARVAHEFGREDLAEIFQQELNRELLLVGGGVGAAAHGLGIATSIPLEFALKNLLECAAADQSRSSKLYREVQKLVKHIQATHALLIKEVASGKLVKVGQSNFLKQLEGLQLQIEALEDREGSRLHTP
jgi:transcriptional regulator with XRE-family HTH domain